MIFIRRINYRRWRRISALVLVLLFIFCLPNRLFESPYAKVMVDNKGGLLMATIASDGQWRFPPDGGVPEKFKTCIVEFEDHRFYNHFGVSFPALVRAFWQNMNSGHVVSGGSTISMQVIRMSRERKGRALSDKLIEMFMAIRLECRYSKEEIMELYAAHAPFGGNVVGIEAASWRYFGHQLERLSWAEAATLAVLPNAPALMHPGKNRPVLLAKRNRLLKRLWQNGQLTEGDYQAAIVEPLTDKPKSLPQLTPHYLQYLTSLEKSNQRLKTQISLNLQRQVVSVVDRHHKLLASRGVQNSGVMVLHIPTGEVRAYVGNSMEANHGAFVDVIQAPRSTGSILKPFLYAGAMDAGKITPKMLLPDYPTRIHGYTPQNYEKSYDGMVPASDALSRSLNIPAVRLLSEYGVGRFKNDLQELGFSTMFRPADEYGLSLILGGAEASLWDLAHAYRNLALSAKGQSEGIKLRYSPSVAFEILEAMCGVNRPGSEQFWRRFDRKDKIAWKTGTSFGARDAWAIGINGDYVVAVWAGNANGEGVAGMTGSNTSGPILFDVFALLPKSSWFVEPVRDMSFVDICNESGHRAGLNCPNKKTDWLPQSCLTSVPCPYHKLLFMNKLGTERRFAGDADLFKHYRFVLPAAAAFYYKSHHPEYQNLPANLYAEEMNREVIAIVYPQANTEILIPRYLNGELGEANFEAVHQSDQAELYWFIDNNFVTSTKDIHQINMQPTAGKHRLTLTDQEGRTVFRDFTISYSSQ